MKIFIRFYVVVILKVGGLNGVGASTQERPDFLSSLLHSNLHLDEDSFEYGGGHDIIPDLESFLLNDN